MEHIDKVKKRSLFEWVRLILLVLAIFALLYTINTLIKNKEIITTDTLMYGMNEHNFTSCICLDTTNQTWYSNNSGFNTHRYSKQYYAIEESMEVNLTNILSKENIAEMNREN